MSYTNGNRSGRKYLPSLLMVLALILFFFPFFQVKMGDIAKFSVTGIDMVTGKSLNYDQQYSNDVYRENGSVKSGTQGNGYMIAAAILAIAGIITGFVRFKKSSLAQGIFAAAAFIAMAIFWSRINEDVDNVKGLYKLLGKVLRDFEIGFSPWFYLSAILLLAAAILGFMSFPRRTGHEAPPVHAPQLPIDNPGEQSEFPTSASESELG